MRSRTWLTLASSITLLGVAFTPSGPASAAFPGANGKIAFESERDGNDEIYVMNADGSAQTRLTNNAATDLEPAWSADGQKLLFSSDRDGNNEIYVMNADGSGQTRLTNNSTEDVDAGWSPDGTKIAFESERDGNDEIYVMNADGSAPTRITNNSAGDYDPVWSPDGTKIAFLSARDGNVEVYVMNADGSAQTRLTNNPADDQSPAWSPDGTKIAFHSDRDGEDEIFVMNADGSAPTSLTTNDDGDIEPAWSPDGTKIVHTHFSSKGSWEIKMMAADGSDGGDGNLVTNNTVNDFEADWQPIVASPAAPETTITKGPKKRTTDRTPTFTFSSTNSGATFECKLDSKPFSACTSPMKYKKQSFGRHTFQVRAIAGGVTDPTPAIKKWRILEG